MEHARDTHNRTTHRVRNRFPPQLSEEGPVGTQQVNPIVIAGLVLVFCERCGFPCAPGIVVYTVSFAVGSYVCCSFVFCVFPLGLLRRVDQRFGPFVGLIHVHESDDEVVDLSTVCVQP